VRQASGDCLPEKKVTPPKPRSNPFGAARPREEVLKEKEATSSKAASAAGSEKGDAAVSPPPSAADAQEVPSQLDVSALLPELPLRGALIRISEVVCAI